MFNDQFVQYVQGMTTYLRKAHLLCPRFVDTRWLSMGRVLEWLVKHTVEVRAHRYEGQPPDEWWIDVFILNDVVKIINETFVCLQGKQLSLDQQMMELQSLRDAIMTKGYVSAKPSDFHVEVGQMELGNFVVNLESTETYIFDLGSSEIVRIVQNQKEQNNENHAQLLKRIADLFLNLVHRIHCLSPERNEQNGPVTRPPPYSMPHAIAEGGSRAFLALVEEQKDRLRTTASEEWIHELEQSFANFHSNYRRDSSFKTLVINTNKCKSFSEAWGWLYKDFRQLVMFVGGLATIFPGTSTVEADFSAIAFEKDKHRKNLGNLSLEGILHGKQRNEIYSLSKQLYVPVEDEEA